MPRERPLWGLALGWPPKYLELDADPWLARVRFLARHGLHATMASLEEWAGMPEDRRRRIAAEAEAHDIRFTIRPQVRWLDEEPAAVARAVDAWLALLERHRSDLPVNVATVGAGRHHRFERNPSLAEQMDRLSRGLGPLAAGCAGLGVPLGIENHGDYYVSDLVALCERVPGLGIYLDTGNVFLVGETPLDAYRAAAPRLVGTHFKDHTVRPRPDAKPLCLEVGNAVLGEGDAPLREAYAILAELTPGFSMMRLEIEFFPSNWMDPLPELERCLAFVRGLGDGRVPAEGGVR